MEKLAIVILNWNGTQMLERYLPSVLKHSQDQSAVYVADNASTDNSLELLERKFPECKIIVLEKNWGFADGYNKALEQIDAEYYLLLNSDIEVTQGWLTPMLSFMNSHPEVAACQPKLLSITNRDTFEYAGASGGFIDKYGYPFCRGRIFNTTEKDNGQYDTPIEIFWATGAALLIRSADYKNVGGFDGRYFAHNEEIDLCWRLRLMGRKIYCIPDSRVYHVGGGTLPKSNPRKTFLNFRNNLTMLYKCLPEKDLSSVMRVRCFLDYLAAFQMLLLQHNWGEFRAVIQARKAFKAWKHEFETDRKRILESNTTDNIPAKMPYSILWKYYVMRKKHFSDL